MENMENIQQLENIEIQLQEINELIIKGAETKNLQQIKEGLSKLKNIIKNFLYFMNNIELARLEKEEEDILIFQLLPLVEEVGRILQNFLSVIEQGEFSRENLEELKEVEKELQEISDSIDTIVELTEEESNEAVEKINSEKGYQEVEDINIEDIEEESIEEDFEEDIEMDIEEGSFELEKTGNEELDKIFEDLDKAIEEDDEEIINEKIDLLLKKVDEFDYNHPTEKD